MNLTQALMALFAPSSDHPKPRVSKLRYMTRSEIANLNPIDQMAINRHRRNGVNVIIATHVNPGRTYTPNGEREQRRRLRQREVRN